MLHGYETREELIRDHWRRWGIRWNVRRCPRLKMPIFHRQYPYMHWKASEETLALDTDIALEFVFERGTLDGRPAARIVCEGVVVEVEPL